MSSDVRPDPVPTHAPTAGSSSAEVERPHRPYSAHFKPLPDSPSKRTGPPRSLSYAYSLSGATSRSRSDTIPEDRDIPSSDLDAGYSLGSPACEFRDAFDHMSSDATDRKGKRKESRDDGWSPRRWFHESPRNSRDEQHGFELRRWETTAEGRDAHDPAEGVEQPKSIKQSRSTSTDDRSLVAKNSVLRRFSFGPTTPDKTGRTKWGRLRSLMPQIVSQEPSVSTQDRSAVVSNHINITDELTSGGLAALILRLWFERDEKGHRRIPILLHRLRIRVSDSLHPMHGSKSVFRIECQYANGAARWVVYKTLRDFFSLHTHYTVSNLQNRNVDKLPEFPRTSLPYFKYLKKEGRDIGHADFARLQRESLENYLLDLIRAVMFHSSANRLATFFEISALSISLAPSGGAQYKAGILHIESSSSNGGGGLGRKSVGWRASKEPKWCVVRESYLVVMEEPGDLAVWDVFLLDPDFKIERPRRYYRGGLNLLHSDAITLHPSSAKTAAEQAVESDCVSVIGSIRSKVSRIFHGKDEQRASNANDPSGDDSSSASSISLPPRSRTPMLDPSTNANPLAESIQGEDGERDEEKRKKARPTDVSKHTFYIVNTQMRLKIFASSERQMLQWITALERVASASPYTRRNRFDSFAPIRHHVAAQWLVDGRDYFWNLSRALLLARESIYIHDWWLSPDLELRRPNRGRYRLDRLLERKAKEGVKVYIILYQEVSSRTTPIDSNYAKQRLLALHPNIMVQRSPSHFQTGTFYWAHHEKMCVIDQTIAFMGGIDLCLGRWDTPQHVLTDDAEGTEESTIWPGKDYSNPRVADFYELNKPDEDMYDRTRVPRMPWHDVGLQVVGQPASDLARHFIQRWNFLLRIKNHSRTMPFLLPPPEFRPGELVELGLTGTCEMQICRSVGSWSMGTLGSKIEHSIQNAYLKAIQMSEHFVYIENQFFITSTVVNDIKIENKVGDAIVHRIIRAHREGTKWKCCVMIPLLPGFTFPVDHNDASAIRIILECQNQTISRGPHSIYGRLRNEGIKPEDYISFFSLRNWAKMRADILTTEQVYIHSKICVVDDRLAIIGSANINERSQRGDRDSELAAVIRDTDMIDCTMAGKPFKVGRFAHTLRVRLMREHLGVDVDSLDKEDMEDMQGPTESAYSPDHAPAAEQEDRTPVADTFNSESGGTPRQADYPTDKLDVVPESPNKPEVSPDTIKGTADHGLHQPTHDAPPQGNAGADQTDAADGDPPIDRLPHQAEGPERKGNVPFDSSIRSSKRKSESAIDGNRSRHSLQESSYMRGVANEGGSDGRTHTRKRVVSKTWMPSRPRPEVDPYGFEDPLSDTFWGDVWIASAVYNTEIYRKTFHCIPDDTVTTWKQYKEFTALQERLSRRSNNKPEPATRTPSEVAVEPVFHEDRGDISAEGHFSSQENTFIDNSTENTDKENVTKPRQPSRSSEPLEQWERDEMEKLLKQLNGHLVLFPTKFLEGEDTANNFLFNADRMMPLPIYD